MNGSQAIQAVTKMTSTTVTKLLSDLSDADLLIRPVPGAHHIAWQLGHVISAEVQIVKGQLPQTPYPELPAGFAEQHSKEVAMKDPPTGYLTKAQYLDLFDKVRAATLAAVSRLSDAELDKPTEGRLKEFFPTLGNVMFLAANHPMMHVGQITVVRRKLGKPVLI
jgi:hypothetical protein